MRLYEIPKGSKIKTTLTSGREVFITFLHLDGMYSYCILEDGDPDNVLHLAGDTELEKVGDYYIIKADDKSNKMGVPAHY